VIKEPAPLSVSYTYDGEECNTGYTGSEDTATYICDGNHLRVSKTVGTGKSAVTTVAIRSGGQVIAEYDNSAAVTSPTREYLYGNNLLAIVTGSTSGAGGTIVYQQHDMLSTRLYTDVNGNDVGEQGTYPFGESWYNNNTTSNWVFTSYERDQESGNDYALARSYANGQGRFLAPDPLEGVVGDPQSWNRYAYVENDPINLSDPSGQGFWEDLGIAIGEIFADVIVALVAPEALPEVMEAEEDADAGFTVTLASGEVLKLAWSAWGAARSAAYNGEHVHQIANGQWVPDGPDVSAGTGGMPSCSCDGTAAAPQGPGGSGAGTAQDTGASGQGPSGGGASGAIWDEAPVPGSRLPNGDIAIGMPVFANSKACPTCGNTWRNANQITDPRTIAAWYGAAYMASPFIVTAVDVVTGDLAIGWQGGELTFTRWDPAYNPDKFLRINPTGDWDNPNQLSRRPHYHSRPGIGNHRPWEGGWW
jgi:RHS repeat-associated protein